VQHPGKHLVTGEDRKPSEASLGALVGPTRGGVGQFDRATVYVIARSSPPGDRVIKMPAT
jgi:hypothetical protein